MAKLRISLTPTIRKIEVFTKRFITTNFIGSYKSVFKGHGLEFGGYKLYGPGDDSRLIDWKATLRANEVLIKEFSEERQLNIFLLIDVSSSMVFGSTQKLKSEYAGELAASLCYAVLEADDAVGFALFSDKVTKVYSPVKSNRQFYLLLRELVNLKNYGGGYNLNKALEFMMSCLKSNSILIIISDFIGLGGKWQELLKVAAGKFDVIGIMVRDPRDRTLPAMNNNVLVEDPFSKKQLLICPEAIKEKYKKYVNRQENTLKDIFKNMGASFISLSTDEDFSRPILKYFGTRSKQFR